VLIEHLIDAARTISEAQAVADRRVEEVVAR
jgi:hypothetical protein